MTNTNNDTRKPVKPEIGKYYKKANSGITGDIRINDDKITKDRYYFRDPFHDLLYTKDGYCEGRRRSADLIQECTANGSAIMKEEVKMQESKPQAFIKPITDDEVLVKYAKSLQNSAILNIQNDENAIQIIELKNEILDLINDVKQAETAHDLLLAKHQRLIDENKNKNKPIDEFLKQLREKDNTVDGVTALLSHRLVIKEPAIDFSEIKVGDTVTFHTNKSCSDIISFTPALVDPHAYHKKLYEACSKDNSDEYKNWEFRPINDVGEWMQFNWSPPKWSKYMQYRRTPPFPVSLMHKYKTKYSKDTEIFKIIGRLAYARTGSSSITWYVETGKCANLPNELYDLTPVEPQYD